MSGWVSEGSGWMNEWVIMLHKANHSDAQSTSCNLFQELLKEDRFSTIPAINPLLLSASCFNGFEAYLSMGLPVRLLLMMQDEASTARAIVKLAQKSENDYQASASIVSQVYELCSAVLRGTFAP